MIKATNVIPLSKGISRLPCNNYRPTELQMYLKPTLWLPTQCIHKNKLFSTVGNIQTNLEHEEYTVRGFVDLRKASDAVVLKLLFTPKFDYYKARRISKKCFISYITTLSNIQHKVQH